ncbi:hypothetical protein CVT24_006323 [Panaeolus cyanescens]|uniref:Uncharacterized protein n=1 Tax=Panaeolus cyanescens TaxID=181874 RepID=A0A409YED8_9AGAR|nr:hypothetical protein CVT24_006323 [Panaeolus cyanescens]
MNANFAFFSPQPITATTDASGKSTSRSRASTTTTTNSKRMDVSRVNLEKNLALIAPLHVQPLSNPVLRLSADFHSLQVTILYHQVHFSADCHHLFYRAQPHLHHHAHPITPLYTRSAPPCSSPLSSSIPPPIPSLSSPRSIPPPQLYLPPPPLFAHLHHLRFSALLLSPPQCSTQYSLPTAVATDPRSPSNSLFNSREQRLTGSDDHLLAIRITITYTSASSLNITTSACWLSSTSKSAHSSPPHHAQPRLNHNELSTTTTSARCPPLSPPILVQVKPINSVTTSSLNLNITASATPPNVTASISSSLLTSPSSTSTTSIFSLITTTSLPTHHHHLRLRIVRLRIVPQRHCLHSCHHIVTVAVTPSRKTLPITKPRDSM